jgi:hypothetical protein
MRQIPAHEMRFLLRACNHDQCFSEISLSISGRVHQGHKDLFVPQAGVQHVLLHHGVGSGETVLGFQPVPNPFGRVALFAGLPLIRVQDLVDNAKPRPSFGFTVGFLRQ